MRKILALVVLSLMFSTPCLARSNGGHERVTTTNLIGANLAGSCTYYGSMGCIPTEADFAQYHALNINDIRLEIHWGNFQPDVGEALITANINIIKTMLGWAASRGMTVTLVIAEEGNGPTSATLHTTHDGLLCVAGPTETCQSYDFTPAHLADTWSRIATAFVGTPGLAGYEIANEPIVSRATESYSSTTGLPQSSADWFTAFQAAINAIRLVDTTTKIYIDGIWYASAYRWNMPGMSGNFKNLVDPSNKLVFTAHMYPDRNNSGTYFDWNGNVAAGDIEAQATGGGLQAFNTNIGVKRISNTFAPWCVANNLQCQIGETSTGTPTNSPNWTSMFDNLMTYVLTVPNIVSVHWHAIGAQWADPTAVSGIIDTTPYTYPGQAGYVYSLNPWASTSVCAGLAKPNMGMISRYNGALPQHFACVYGPEQGPPETENTFLIMYNSRITEPFDFTLSDGGAGGSFGSSTISCSAGDYCIQPITYTPPNSAAFYDISATSNSQSYPIGTATLAYTTEYDQFSKAGVTSSQQSSLLSLRRISTFYSGPVVNLRRASDNATADFGFTTRDLNAPVDVAAITTWANGSSVYVRIWYDQSLGNAYDSTESQFPQAYSAVSGPDFGASSGWSSWWIQPSTPANTDEPEFVLNCKGTLPCIRFSAGNRMWAYTNIRYLYHTPLSVLTVASFGSSSASNLVGWDTPYSHYNFPSSGNWNMADLNDVTGTAESASLSLNISANTWGSYAGTWLMNNASGMSTFKDGALLSSTASFDEEYLHLQYPSDNDYAGLSFGFTSGASGNCVADVGEIKIVFKTLSEEDVQSFYTDEDSYWDLTP